MVNPISLGEIFSNRHTERHGKIFDFFDLRGLPVSPDVLFCHVNTVTHAHSPVNLDPCGVGHIAVI